jgi:hypothetical protein
VNHLAKLVCAALSILLVAHADTGGKPSSSADRANAPSQLTGFSAWKPIILNRDGPMNPWGKRKDFNDSRFEYRWKSERTANSSVCTVEIRPTDDVDVSETIPEIGVNYSGQDRIIHLHGYTARDVRIGSKLEHAFLKPPDCDRVDLVYWHK